MGRYAFKDRSDPVHDVSTKFTSDELSICPDGRETGYGIWATERTGAQRPGSPIPLYGGTDERSYPAPMVS